MSFKKRLTISLLAVAIVPVFLVTIILSRHSVIAARTQYEYTIEKLLESNVINLDRALKNAHEALIQLLSTPDLVSMLTDLEQGETDLNLDTRINKIYAAIYSLQNLEKDIFDNIGVYSESMESTVISAYRGYDPNIADFYEEVKAAAGKPVWITVPNGSGENGEKKGIYIAAAALRPYKSKVVGIVYIKMKYEFFERLMESADDTYGEALFLVGNQQLISNSKYFSADWQEIWNKKLTGNHDLIHSKNSQVTDWTLVFLGQEKIIVQAALSGAGPVLLAAALAVGAALALAAGLSFSAYRPVHRMLHVFANIDRDSLGIRVEEKGDSELRQITESMNQMMERIGLLVLETEREKEARFGAEMAALRAQINPHFLYNTLNVIKYLAVSGRSNDAEKACVSLIHLLRTSIGNNRECITLQEELSYITNYTQLMQLRMDRQFELADEIGEEFRDLIVPKFTLQPIVENSIIHGFSNSTSSNTIFFRAELNEEKLVIRVTDNGKGISEERLMELERMLREKEGLSFSKVGILNVNERIRHIFGEDYGISLTSYEEEGTQVQIVLPCIREEKERE